MKIKDIMSKSIISVLPNTGIASIARTLSEHKIHGVPVIEGKELIGIITETDFFTKDAFNIHLPTYKKVLERKSFISGIFQKKDELDEKAFTAEAKDIMTADCVTISPEAELEELVKLVREKDLHTVPVVSGGVLVGVVTVADIIKLIA